ncbi:hypothetical protein AB0E01_44305, partial [Nocardia vinacea]
MPIVVEAQGMRHVFDCFECAIHRMAPICEHCNCKIIGHGVEADGRFFCCVHCAVSEGAKGLVLQLHSCGSVLVDLSGGIGSCCGRAGFVDD